MKRSELYAGVAPEESTTRSAPQFHTDPDTGARKEVKVATFALIPAQPLWQLAEHYGRGAQKYSDRNWEGGYDWSLSFNALQRHAWAWWNGEDIDPEMQAHHLIAAAWHAFALVEFTRTHPEKDDRPRP